MKSVLCLVCVSLVWAVYANAQNIRAMSDAEQLGMTAGLALACGSQKNWKILN